MNTGLVLVAFVAAWMVAGVILASAFGSRLRRCAETAAPARHEVVIAPERRGVEPLRWVLPASIVVMAVASSTGLAAAGVLPPRVQVVARSVFGTVGLDVPDAPETYAAEGSAPTPAPPAPRPVVPSPAPGSATVTTGDRPVRTPSSAVRGPSDPFPDGLGAAVADHLAAAEPAVPTPVPPGTSPGDLVGRSADDPPAAVPPRTVPPSGDKGAGRGPAPDVATEAGAVRPPSVPAVGGPAPEVPTDAGAVDRPKAPAGVPAAPDLPTESRPDRPDRPDRPPKHAPGTRPDPPPEAPVAVPPPVAPVAEPPARPAGAPAPAPPAADPQAQAVPDDVSPRERARLAREQRRIEREQEKEARRAQADQVAPVPPPAVDPSVPTSTLAP